MERGSRSQRETEADAQHTCYPREILRQERAVLYRILHIAVAVRSNIHRLTVEMFDFEYCIDMPYENVRTRRERCELIP